MKKGIRCSELNHQHDISHSLSMLLERTYKYEPDFLNYQKLMSDIKRKYNMTKTAYLFPPTQRTIARFLDLSCWVKWSSEILEVYHTLKAHERSLFI